MRISKRAFANYIKERRNLMGITQEELAERLHVSRNVVSKWECGLRFPDFDVADDLATALGVSVQELYDSARKEEFERPVNVNMIVILAIVVTTGVAGIIAFANGLKLPPATGGPSGIPSEPATSCAPNEDSHQPSTSHQEDESEFRSIKEGTIQRVTVESLPNRGYSRVYTGEDADALADYFIGLHLIADFVEDPDEYSGATWVITIEYEEKIPAVTIYHFGNMFIRKRNGKWYRMKYEEAVLFKDLLGNLGW